MKHNKTFFIYYICIVLSSVTFYNPLGIISPTLGKLFFYSFCLLGLIAAIKKGKSLEKTSYPRKAYKMIMGGILFSILMPVLYQQQPLQTTIIATLPYLFGYMVFFILMKFNIPKEKIRNTLWIFCFIGMFIYIINLISVPNIIFGEGKDEFDLSRGFIRLAINSLELIVLFFLYSINQWLTTKKRIYLFLIALAFTFIILSVVRQYILISIFLGLLFILQKSSIVKKIIVIIICISFYFIFLPKIPLYQKMSELTKEQVEKNNYQEEDIRIQAWKFYTYEYQTNYITSIFGNGIPSMGNSSWGNKVEKEISRDYGGNGCYFVDVGWAGFYWLFGIISTSGLLLFLVQSIFKKKGKNQQYLSYWCVFILLTSITSGPILFYKQIVSIVTVFYLIYGTKTENNRNYNPKLQQL